MRVLRGGDDTDCFFMEKRQRCSNDRRVEIHTPWHVQDIGVGDERGMAEVNEYIGICKQFEGEVAGPVAGIAADDDGKALPGKGIRDLCCLSLEPGRELECYR
jgi:hypothetical protein